ncbi:MAG: hypothetical protein H3C55_12560 [Pseudorhodoplanes sp.]|nr:hypothetical protein [Pseudorhodoplanes sp.]
MSTFEMAQQATKRQWISGLAIVLTTLVCLFAFWRLAPEVTFVIALVALVALLFVFWLAGKGN